MPLPLPLLLLCLLVPARPAARPHILLVVADDLGWGDVGWNNPRMADVTRKLGKLAQGGVVLDQYYVQQVCTPRAAHRYHYYTQTSVVG